MGVKDEQQIQRSKSKRTSQPAQQSGRWKRPTNAEPCDLTAVSPGLIAEAVVRVAVSGAALMVSTTRDGGAVCLTLFDNDTRDKMYAHSVEEIEVALQGLIEEYSE